MGILDGIVEWIAEQIMYGLDLINSSVLGALGCDMSVFLQYFPAAETMYSIFVALAVGLILLFWAWNLFRNYFLGAGAEAEDPVKLSLRSGTGRASRALAPSICGRHQHLQLGSCRQIRISSRDVPGCLPGGLSPNGQRKH